MTLKKPVKVCSIKGTFACQDPTADSQRLIVTLMTELLEIGPFTTDLATIRIQNRPKQNINCDSIGGNRLHRIGRVTEAKVATLKSRPMLFFFQTTADIL